MDIFLGKSVKPDIFKIYFYPNGGLQFDQGISGEYMFDLIDVIDTPQESELKITEALRARYKFSPYSLRVYATINGDGTLKSAEIFKFREGNSGHYKPDIQEMCPTKQEERILYRIMSECFY